MPCLNEAATVGNCVAKARGFYAVLSAATLIGVILDFGHVDLFHAQNAANLVWSPIYQWLSRHNP